MRQFNALKCTLSNDFEGKYERGNVYGAQGVHDTLLYEPTLKIDGDIEQSASHPFMTRGGEFKVLRVRSFSTPFTLLLYPFFL